MFAKQSGRRRGSGWTASAPAVLLAAAMLTTYAGPAALAGTDDELRAASAEVESLEAALEDTSAELATAYLALQQAQAQLPAARARVATADAAALTAERHNQQVGEQLAVAEANIARAEEAAATNASTKERTQRTLDAFAADMFQGDGQSQLSVALGATSADDFATRLVLADTVSAMTNQALDNLAAAKADGAATEAYLDAVRIEVAELKRQAELALAEAQARRAEAQQAQDALDTLVAQQDAHANDVATRRAGELAALAAAEAEKEQLRQALAEEVRRAKAQEAGRISAAAEAARKAGKPAPVVAPPPQTRTGFLSRPISGGRISSEFGMRLHPILNYWRLHSGMDFAVGCGTPIHAAADGRVVSAGWGGGYGNRIVLTHGVQRGVVLMTTYNHMSGFAVRGGSVSRGQVIGYVGTTGSSTGCHLHFETLQDGGYVNPRIWL
ncbi:MAG: M23 family metallopeptidase [Actinomycetales bacterium]|nr:M23 family metallopeptidase [Actinomycetales bacterium]